MKFLVDAQLPPSVAAWLRSAGCEAAHVVDIALRDSEDNYIRSYAAQNGCVLVTKDRDFVSADQSASENPPILWVRKGNISNTILYQRLKAGWPQILAHLEAGARIVELR